MLLRRILPLLIIIFLYACIGGCGSGGGSYSSTQDQTDSDQDTTSNVLSATWLGYYQSSFIDATYIKVELEQDDTTLSGTFADPYGREGIISGTIDGDEVSLDFRITTKNCDGEFWGTGLVDTNYFRDNTTILFDFSGSDCLGDHTDGNGVLIMQPNEVLAWGQYSPTSVTYHSGDLLWSDSSIYPLKSLNLESEEMNALAPLMYSVSGLTIDDNAIIWTERNDISYDDSPCRGSGVGRLIMAIDTDGTNYRSLAVGNLCYRSTGKAEVISDGTYVYWIRSIIDDNDDFGYAIDRVPLSGDPPERFASPGKGLEHMAADDTYLYWAENGDSSQDEFSTGCKIFRYALDGSQEAPETIFYDDTLSLFSYLLLMEDKIIIRYANGKGIGSIPITGGDFTSLVLGTDYILWIDADEQNIYWSGCYGNPYYIKTIPIEGGEVDSLVSVTFPLYSEMEINRIALSPTRVYWSMGSEEYPLGIYYVNKSGGSINLLTEAAFPTFMRVDSSGDVIYADGGSHGGEPTGIYRVSPSGNVDPIIVGVDGSVPIAVNDDYIFVKQGGNLKRVDRYGPNVELASTEPVFEEIFQIEIDHDYVYWGSDITLYRAPVNNPSDKEIVANMNGGEIFRICDGYAYWVHGGSREIFRVPVTGGDPEQITQDSAYINNFIVDNQYIYIIQADALTISKMPVTGGAKTWLANPDFNFGWYTMDQDSDNIYWATPDGIFKVSKNGGDQTMLPVPPFLDQGEVASIAVDQEYLYWTDPYTGSIKRELK